MHKTPALTLMACFMFASHAFAATAVVNSAVTEPEVLSAQQTWCEDLLKISDTFTTQGQPAAKALTEKVIDEIYGYQFGAVLFKPTLAAAPQAFRLTKEGAVSYFVGGDPAYPHDHGFTSKGWTKCEIANAGIFIAGNTATTMGNVLFTDKDGKMTVVDKTWEFMKDDAGKLRIMVHQSSLPYVPATE